MAQIKVTILSLNQSI